MTDSERVFSIAEAVEAIGLTRNQIRYFARLHLVEVVPGTEGGRPSYSLTEDAVQQLTQARELRARGYSPREVVRFVQGNGVKAELEIVEAYRTLLSLKAPAGPQEWTVATAQEAILAVLPDPERAVIGARYVEQQAPEVVGRNLGLSVRRVGELEQKGIAQIGRIVTTAAFLAYQEYERTEKK